MNNHHDDGVINLRVEELDEEPDFKIHTIEEERVPRRESFSNAVNNKMHSVSSQPSDQVKVKFDKFVNLIASHDCSDIIDKYMDEDIVVSTDLLTEIANSHQEGGEDKKIPFIFLIGIVLGVVLTWILLK